VFHAPFVGLVVSDATTPAQWGGWNGSTWIVVLPRLLPATVNYDPPSLAAGATALLDITVTGACIGDLLQASLATSSRFFELDATAWSNNTVRVRGRNVSNTTIDLAAATLSVQVTKRRAP
jgi:hypothetical protein